MSDSYLFTSESVSEGHPDKVADQISDAVLDAMLAQDKRARVACETLVKTGVAIVAGEVTTEAWVDLEELVRGVIVDIGYTSSQVGFDGRTCGVTNILGRNTNDRVWTNWTKLRAWQSGGPLVEHYMNPERRALLKPAAIFEVENWLKLTAAEIREASLVRTQWYQAVRRFMETYEFMVIPSAQLFPFDAKLDWPHEIGGRQMQNYYDWMNAQVQITMSAAPSLNVPAGFSPRGQPMGMQIVGRHQADLSCLQLAYAYEQATNWVEMRRPALLGA